MRLGIRGKLIGTLILVGLFPLVMSLVVVLGGGAAYQIKRIRGSYEENASLCAERISDALLHEEVEKLLLLARIPRITDLVNAQNPGTPPGPGAPEPPYRPEDEKLDKLWPSLRPTDPQMAALLNNELSRQLQLLSGVDGHTRQTFITNAASQVIAMDAMTDDYFQADELWWKEAFNHGSGRLYINSLITHTANPKVDVIEIAVPIYTTIDGKRFVAGILKDKLSVSWLFGKLHDTSVDLGALTQLIDMERATTVYAAGGGDADVLRSENFYFEHKDVPHVSSVTQLFNDLVIGSAAVPIKNKLVPELADARIPEWVVVVSKPSREAMTPVYHLAMTVAVIGVALILVLFILGVAISNREIIMPILRLREATAAVGRGELHVRLMSSDAKDKTFRRDELGDLARDFDEMTRQLQKNVNQLARSNEAKRRFMELAGHELRTPVTFLLGVCQLTQRQVQQLGAAATDGVPEDEQTMALAAKNAASINSALIKVAAKSQRLSRIIENLLKLVNNDQFTTRMNKEPVDIRALILQVTGDHKPFVAERKQQLVVDVPDNLPSIEADRDKLEDALINLVSNAIRFSPDGGLVRVAAHVVVGDMLEILVEDSGPGIPADDLANLFEPFYTGSDILHHHSGTYEHGSKGLGLGLAIVRRFIELHGGIVRAHAMTHDGKTTGTQFQILLPLNPPADAAPGAAPGG